VGIQVQSFIIAWGQESRGSIDPDVIAPLNYLSTFTITQITCAGTRIKKKYIL